MTTTLAAAPVECSFHAALCGLLMAPHLGSVPQELFSDPFHRCGMEAKAVEEPAHVRVLAPSRSPLTLVARPPPCTSTRERSKKEGESQFWFPRSGALLRQEFFTLSSFTIPAQDRARQLRKGAGECGRERGQGRRLRLCLVRKIHWTLGTVFIVLPAQTDALSALWT